MASACICAAATRPGTGRRRAATRASPSAVPEARIRFFFLEYDSPRAGGFEPLQAVPDDKTVVIGAMTTKSGFLESVDMLKSQIKEAARYVDLERLAISPQCGFSSSVEGVMDEQQERAKLARLVEVAQDIWGSV